MFTRVRAVQPENTKPSIVPLLLSVTVFKEVQFLKAA